jgi:hypothetical protein
MKLTSLHSDLEAKKLALTVEKENETAILRHQCELKQRLKDLTEECLSMENKQTLVSKPF